MVIVALLFLTASFRSHRNIVMIVRVQTSEDSAQHAAVGSRLVMIKVHDDDA